MSKKIIRQKINDTFLRKALAAFAKQYPAARAAAFEGTDFETLRERISTSRKAALKQLPVLLDEFRTNAEKSGATVHLCSTPQDALEDYSENHPGKKQRLCGQVEINDL